MTRYLFLDEGGNLDFSPTGSPWFVMTCVTTNRPFTLHPPLDEYKHDCLEYGLNTEYFHCAEDNAHVRARVFDVISANLEQLRIDALIVEKRKTSPELREEHRFYPEMLGYLLRYVVEEIQVNQGKEIDEEIIVITDTLPLQRKRKAIEKAVRMTLRRMLPDDCHFRVLHHASRSHFGLQVADYCNWAISRRWTRGDLKHYQQIESAIASEFEIFNAGAVLYY